MKIPDNSMRDHLQKLSEQKFTGDVVFKFHFNQGGIRSSKITLEKVLPLTGEDI